MKNCKDCSKELLEAKAIGKFLIYRESENSNPLLIRKTSEAIAFVCPECGRIEWFAKNVKALT